MSLLGTGGSKVSPSSCCVRGEIPSLHLSPPQNPNPGAHSREGGDAQLREPCLGMAWPLHRLTLPGKICFIPSLVPAMAATAAPACFVLGACDELLLAPGWLLADGNLPQPLLLISQSCWIPLGAATPGGKVPFPTERGLGGNSVPIPNLWLLLSSPGALLRP